MQVPLQIVVRHMAHSAALETRIREDAAKLEEFYRGIVGCHVVVEERGRHRQQGRCFNVCVAVRTPGHELIASRDLDEDVYVALRDAFAICGEAAASGTSGAMPGTFWDLWRQE